jgi:fluoroquinolone transport system permease protein
MARYLLPLILGRLEATLHVSLDGLYPVIAGYALLITAPVICGTVIGFLLLDERDDRTLLALRVTPLPPGGYLAWRLSLPMLLSVLTTLITFPLAGLEKPGVMWLLVAALIAAPLAPLMALALATFASNKVQGFALMKASGVFQMAPLVAYFASEQWQMAFWILPNYWTAKLLWALQSGEARAWPYLAAGLTYQAFVLLILSRRFNRLVA